MTESAGVLGRDWQRDIRYPVVYKVTTGWRVLMVVMALFFAVGGLAIDFTVLQRSQEPAGLLFLGLFTVMPLSIALYLVCYAMGARLTLERDAIEMRKAFGGRVLRRAEIRGRRITQGRSANYKQIVPISGRALTIDSSSLGLDDRFYAWFNALPDLDGDERAATLAEVQNDPSLGSNAQERMASLAKAQKLAKVIGFLPFVLVMWVVAFPRPYGLAIACAALAPWLGVALVWLKPGLFKLDGRAGDVRPNVGALLLMPPLALVLRALRDVSLVDIGPLLTGGLLLGLPLVVAVVAAPSASPDNGKRPWRLALIMLPFFAIWGGSLLALTDAMWDKAPPQVFQTTVTGKDVSRGKTTTYYVHLARWNPTIDEQRIAVPRAYFETVDRGDVVCVRLHPGRFGLRWVQLAGCG